MTAGLPLRARTADWIALAERLYAASVVGVSGARPWADLSGDTYLEWFAKAEADEAGRRRYLRDWGDLPCLTPWESLREESRAGWIHYALTSPGRVL